MTHDELPDEMRETIELVQKAQTGDRAAMEEVLERYYPRVLGVVRARLGQKLRRYVESADVVQDTMGQVVKDFDVVEMRDEEALIRWISFLVENRIRDTAKFFGARKRGSGQVAERLVTGLDSEERPLDARLVDDAPSPPEKAARSEARESLEEGLASLSAEHREILERKAAQETWSQIAEAMGLGTIDTARGLYARARLALMKAVASDLEGEHEGG